MDLRVNGEPFEAPGGLTVRALIEQLGLGRGPVAVERNGSLVPRVAHRDTELRHGDVVEILELSGGG